MTSTVYPCRRCGNRRTARNGEAVCRDCVTAPPGAHQPWMSHSACISPAMDPEWWFPPSSAPADAERAVEICRGCKVKDLCLEYAIHQGIEHGIWGGRSAPERHAIRKARRRAS